MIKYEDIFFVVKNINWDIISGVDSKTRIDVIEKFKDFDLSIKNKWEYEQEFYKNGRLYEGVFYILPVLINSLKLHNNPFKSETYTNIQEIIHWESDGNQVCNFEIRNDPFRYYFPSKSKSSIKLPLRMACRFAVIQEIDFFIKEINDTQTILSKHSIDLLSMFEESSYFIYSHFESIKKGITDSELKNYIGSYMRDFEEEWDSST